MDKTKLMYVLLFCFACSNPPSGGGASNPQGCIAQSDCPQGSWCSLGVCVEGAFPGGDVCACSDIQSCAKGDLSACMTSVPACKEHFLCLTDADCNDPGNCDAGICRCTDAAVQCTSSSECPRNLHCNPSGVCGNKHPCVSDGECVVGSVCREGVCVVNENTACPGLYGDFYARSTADSSRNTFSFVACKAERSITRSLPGLESFNNVSLGYLIARVKTVPALKLGVKASLYGRNGVVSYEKRQVFLDDLGRAVLVYPVLNASSEYVFSLEEAVETGGFSSHSDVLVEYAFLNKKICIDDRYDGGVRNDVYDHASVLLSMNGVSYDVVLCSRDEDWFYYDASEGRSPFLSVQVLSQEKKMSLDVYGFKDNALVFLKSYTNASDVLQERIPLHQGSQRYYMRFYKGLETQDIKASFSLQF